LASILFASASFGGGGCSVGAYQQIIKNMLKKILSRWRIGFDLDYIHRQL